MKVKLLIVGLDGATFSLIRPWSNEGLLPNLKMLMEGGSSGVLTSTILPITAPAWASFVTGVNPGKHGLYDFSVREEGGYGMVPVNGSYRKARAYWEYLAHDGVRAGVVNMPGSYPPEPINGFMVTGMLTPSTETVFTSPAELGDELRSMGYRILFDEVYSGNNEDAVLESVLRTAETRREVLLHLIQTKPWDIFFTVLPETDNLSHFFWGFMDRDHPLHDTVKGLRYGDALQKVYRQADETIGRLLSCIDEETMVMIMSDHGSGPLHKNLFLNNYLIQLGLMKMKRTASTQAKRGLTRVGFTITTAHDLLTRVGMTKKVRHSIGYSGKKSLLKRMLNLFLSFDDVDWTQTRAYSSGNYGQIFINLRGREPQGIVQFGLEYETLREQIIDHLEELRDPETGSPIVDKAFKREEIYSGPYLDQAPDIVFLPHEMKYMTSRFLEFASSRIVEPAARHRTGGHTMEGICILRGPGVRSEHRIEGARLLDVTPTILHLFGSAIPREMDGRVLTDIFESDSPWARRSPRISEVPIDRYQSTAQSEEGDQEMIRRRLQGLGYIA
jgi:predicted AlkP superfamily phosphohydrolase/phosphomutase